MSQVNPIELAGGCHCGAVQFSAETESHIALECNCSICHMSGFLHVIVPQGAFKLLQGGDDLSTYRFNTENARHTFCRRCGVKPFYWPRSHPNGVSINLRCIADEYVRALFTIQPFDGLNWEENVASISDDGHACPSLGQD
jgi:hypothetical protein